MGIERCWGRGCYLRELSDVRNTPNREKFGADSFLGQSPVSLRPEVGDAADQRVPPGGESRSWGPLVSGKKREEGVGMCAGWAVIFGPRGRKELAGGERKGKGRI